MTPHELDLAESRSREENLRRTLKEVKHFMKRRMVDGSANNESINEWITRIEAQVGAD